MKFRSHDDDRYRLPDVPAYLHSMVGTHFVAHHGCGFNPDGSGGFIVFVNAEGVAYRLEAFCKTDPFFPDSLVIQRISNIDTRDAWTMMCCREALHLDEAEAAARVNAELSQKAPNSQTE